MMQADHNEQLRRQLALIAALDHARDSVHLDQDAGAMLRAVVDVLCEWFHADAGAILILDESGHDADAIITRDMQPESAIALCRMALQPDAPQSEAEDWKHTLCLPIVQDANEQVLGSLVLARQGSSFNDEDLELINIAEGQIDSAIIQARMIWDLLSHNRQLEAIYAIDHLRDNMGDENALISGFTNILIEYFDASLCLVILSHIDSGELIVRSLVDRDKLPAASIAAIREQTRRINGPMLLENPDGISDIQMLGAPLIVSGVKLGAVVVGRRALFTQADHRLLYAMMSQMDSAIANSRISIQLIQRNMELETIYQIDQIRDRETDFDTMLQMVLSTLCRAVSSEIGYLMLYKENDEQQLEIKATTTEDIITSPAYHAAINTISQQALETAEPVYSNQQQGAVRSIVAIPLILNDKIIGVFGTINSTNPNGFSAEDRRMLTAITSQVDTAVFERLERRRMRRVMSRSVDPKVLEHLLQHADEHTLAGERVVLSVLFADLRGSTEWAERTEPEQLVSTLNAFLGRMTDVIFANGGTLDKFVGDEVIALFGTPIHLEDHAMRAARCALEMRNAHQKLVEELAAQGIELPPVGIGVASGEVIAGEFGPAIRTDFTAIGRVMNLGARLCSAAGPLEVFISEVTCQTLGDAAETRQAQHELKGLGNVKVFELLNMKA